jgi:triacylglycerol lipase
MDWHDTVWIASALLVCLLALALVARALRPARRKQLPPAQRRMSPAAGRAADGADARAPTADAASTEIATGAETARSSAPPSRILLVKRPLQTRHPIVLAHGWGGLEGLLPVRLGYSYFRGIPDALRARGHEVHIASVSPTASIELRAKQLADQISRIDRRVNIIAHSMGGLDARLALSRFGLHEHVASLTTIGTPHHGTPLADAAFVLGEWRRSRGLLNRLGLNVDGVYDVSTARMKEFNREVPDAPGVLYTNVVAAVDLDVGGVHAMLSYGHRYLLRTVGENDGVVPAVSQVWGETLEEVDADHWAQIGWFAQFDVHGFYARIAQCLIEREL